MFFVLNRQRFFDIKIECAPSDVFLYFLQLAKEENFDEYMRKELWIKENFNVRSHYWYMYIKYDQI